MRQHLLNLGAFCLAFAAVHLAFVGLAALPH